ncbi:hypothetical protein [Ravibacter arvi]
MKKLIFTLIGFLSISLAHAQYDNFAVGFKLGEPTGINIRKYFNNINALDLTVGTYGGIIGNNRDYRSGKYKNVGLAVQVHYLWHTPLFNSENLHLYYGFGGQINSRKYYADNRAHLPSPGNYEKSLSIGGSLLGGFEYFLPDGRLSIFAEGGTYIEVLQRPFFLSPNVSAGLRINL